MSTDPSDTQIIVCDACLRASCWAGDFMCDAARMAGTITMSVAQLQRLNREHPRYWEPPDAD